VTRRNYTPSAPLPKPDQHGQRRSAGGARREASDRIVFRSEGVETNGWTLNVSRGGIRVIVEENIELGREYELLIGDQQTPRRGRVVWVQDEADGQIAGVQYLDVEGSSPPSPEGSKSEPSDPKKP
jgi:hypothetical protein